MNPELQDRLRTALERPHRLGMIGGDLEEQLAHCASFSRVLAEVPLEPGDRAADLGTGGGVPGLALALARPDLDWYLVEVRVARATELERAALRSGLDLQVVTEPAQDFGHVAAVRGSFQLVTARAFGPPSFTAECAAALLRPGGALVVSEPPDDTTSARWPSEALGRLGLGPAETHSIGGAGFMISRCFEPPPPDVARRPARTDRGWYGT